MAIAKREINLRTDDNAGRTLSFAHSVLQGVNNAIHL